MDHQAVERLLAAARQSGSRALDRECDLLAQRYLAEEVEPQFAIDSADFAANPALILADRYWNLRFRQEPTMRTAIECAGWLDEHADPECLEPIREKWTMGYGFITRSTVDSAGEIADATADIVGGHAGSRAYFATLYHAGKLRADRSFDELYRFLESSPLAVSISGTYGDRPLFVALRALAAFGSVRITTEHALALFRQVWDAPDRTRDAIDVALNGLAAGDEFDGQGELLRTRAAEAVAAYPDDHMFLFRLAIGRRLCADYDAALVAIRLAHHKLPKIGWRISHDLLQEQFDSEERLIRSERTIAVRLRAAREQELAHRQEMAELIERHKHDIGTLTSRYEQQLRDIADGTQRSQVRTIELVALFAAIIAFAVGSLNVTLNGSLGLAARLWMIAELGGGLLAFALLIVGGTWFVARRMS